MTKKLNVGNCISIACANKGMSMSQLSAKAGKHDNWLYDMIGKGDILPTYRSMMMICKALNMGFVELLVADQPGFKPEGYRELRPDINRCVVRACRLKGTGMHAVSIKAGMCQNWIAALSRRNRPSIRSLTKMADALDMDVIELLTCWGEM